MVAANDPLPLLEQIQIASPCTADWNAMSGDERSRYCGQCRKHVYNLSEMTRAEAEALIVEKEGNFCGRLFRRTDGTVITKDCPIGVLTIRKRLRRAFVALLLLGGTLFAGALHACGMRLTAKRMSDSGALSSLRSELEPQFQGAFGAVFIPAVAAPPSSNP